MASHWPYLSQQLNGANNIIQAVLDKLSQAPEPHSALGRVWLQYGSDAVVVRLSLMRANQYAKAVKMAANVK